MSRVPTRRRPARAPRARPWLPCALSAPLLFLLSGCGGDDKTVSITDVRERADAGPPARSVPTEERFRMTRESSGMPGANPHGASSRRWEWTTPQGWAETGARQFREMGWQVQSQPDLEASFATAGGAFLANLNRWRGQMALGEVDAAAVAALPTKPFLGFDAKWVDLSGQYTGPPMAGGGTIAGARMLVLVAQLPATSAVLKMVGPSSAVAAEEERFLALAASIKPAAPGTAEPPPPDDGPGPEPAARPAPFKWTVPEGWAAKPSKSVMRLATFGIAKAPDAECYVSMLNGDGGGTKRNVEVWYEQVGKKPPTDAELSALPRAPILGGRATFVSVEGAIPSGTGGDATKPWMLVGMILERGDHAVFVKLVGPPDQVRGEQDRFRAFCESFRE